jgi:hypothetical protein
VTGLRDCSYYRYGVVAVGPDGQTSDPGEMAGGAFTQGLPNRPLPVVTILSLGVDTQMASAGLQVPGEPAVGVVHPCCVQACVSAR